LTVTAELWTAPLRTRSSRGARTVEIVKCIVEAAARCQSPRRRPPALIGKFVSCMSCFAKRKCAGSAPQRLVKHQDVGRTAGELPVRRRRDGPTSAPTLALAVRTRLLHQTQRGATRYWRFRAKLRPSRRNFGARQRKQGRKASALGSRGTGKESAVLGFGRTRRQIGRQIDARSGNSNNKAPIKSGVAGVAKRVADVVRGLSMAGLCRKARSPSGHFRTPMSGGRRLWQKFF